MSKPKVKGACAFCEYVGELTGEHAWPKWLADVLPLTYSASRYAEYTLDRVRPQHSPLSAPNLNLSKIRRSGDPGSRKMPIACAACNNGWMSALQLRAKPIVELLVQDRWPETDFDHHTLAAWCAMTFMVFELNLVEGVTTQQERVNFKSQRHPPPDWHIWIKPCPSENPNRRAAIRTMTVVSPAPGPYFGLKPNGFIGTFAAGNFLFQILKAPTTDSEFAKRVEAKKGMREIYPALSSQILIKPEVALTGRVKEHEAMLSALFNFNLI